VISQNGGEDNIEGFDIGQDNLEFSGFERFGDGGGPRLVGWVRARALSELGPPQGDNLMQCV
jgi:hypothetical protein